MSDNNTPAEKNVPVYVEDENAGKLQIGWATPEVDGVRTIQRFGIFESLQVENIIFGDAEAPKTDSNGDTEKIEAAPATAEVNAQPKPEDAQPVEGTTARRNK